jgi:AraC-like DNA-binding protein
VLTFLPDAQVEATTFGIQFSTMAHEVGQGEKSVAQQATEAGMSREAFTRRFARLFGMPPHAHNIVERLNDARRQLRSGASPADVAAACGFYDQTHMTRHFFRVFGATPGAYRKSVGRSQTYER